MTIKTDNGTVIDVYDSISELPRYVAHRLKKYSIQSASLETDIRSQIVETSHWLNREKLEEAKTCLENVLMSLFAIDQDHSFQDQEFGAIVRRVDGVDFVWSENAVKQLIIDSEITDGLLVETLEIVKKKLIDQLAVSFPKRHNGLSFLVEQNSLLIKYAKAQLVNIQEQTEASNKALTEAFNDIMDARPPSVLNPRRTDSVLIEMDKSDGKLSVSLMGNGVNDPARMTVFELECAIENLSKNNGNTQPGQRPDLV